MQSLNTRESAAEYGMRGWAVRVLVSMTVLSTVTVAIRLVSRRIRRQKLWWDDWLCVISMVWGLGTVSVILTEIVINGMGFQEIDLDAQRRSRLVQVFFVGELVYCCNIAITKIAVLLLYYRLFQVAFQTSRTLRIVAYSIGALVIAASLLFIFMVIFECSPVQKRWQPHLPGYCLDQKIRWILNAGLTILTDVAVLILPVPEIWKMRLGILERIGITSILALGWCVTFISGYRLHLLLGFPDNDFSYSIVPIVVWSYIEIVIGLVSACLPVSKPAAQWVTHKLCVMWKRGCFSRLGLARSQGSSKSVRNTVTRDQGKRVSMESDSQGSTESRTASIEFSPSIIGS